MLRPAPVTTATLFSSRMANSFRSRTHATPNAFRIPAQVENKYTMATLYSAREFLFPTAYRLSPAEHLLFVKNSGTNRAVAFHRHNRENFPLRAPEKLR
jgi:hypothetical protein